MPGQLIVFSIPIYLRSGERYYEEHKRYEEKELEWFCSLSGESPDEARKRLGVWWEERCFWPPWEFNDIVGYTTIYYDGSFYAELWKLDRKRINRDPRQRRGSIKWSGKVSEVPSNIHYPSNESLRCELIELLSQIKKYIRKRQWYVDIQYWENIVASLDCKDFLRQRGASKYSESFSRAENASV